MRELLPSPASSQTVTLDLGDVSLVSMFGVHDEVLREVEAQCPGVSIVARGNTITLSGPDPSLTRAQELLEDLRDLAGKGVAIVRSDVARTVDIQATTGARAAGMLSTPIVSSRGHSIRPKTVGQKNYVDAIDDHTIVFGIGPAGTGKTYLAMAKAVAALEAKQVDRIILTRPAVEAGERLGFLPGTLTDKIDPYLRPLFDALHEMMDPDLVPKLLASGTVEVAPLAYMRGRTLNSAFIILDEAQNTSPEQMKMFLTRLGFGSKMIITGDVTQVDLPTGASGLTTVGGILDELEDIHFEYLSAKDVVRHSLVSRIVDAYAEFEASKRGR
ncbi:MAG: PhoH family protein [Microbacteriaceae bacterium]|nr:PhoH family protein [Microbacteriaceae bacterium]MBT5730389.1 PhoH family protein [Microbacteriaceae bacterium]